MESGSGTGRAPHTSGAPGVNPAPRVVRTVEDLRREVRAWRDEGLRSALVPTLGGLHEGHVSLVRIGLRQADRVVVSLFLNPTQFGPQEDLAQYPAREAADLEVLAREGANLAFVPPVAEMYPNGFQTRVTVAGLAEGLCGDHRPGHFEGVATVVTKLLLQAGTDLAVFGEKDYQQLCVVRRLVRDLDIPTTIVAGPTVRDEGGLALSSRNAYLDAADILRARKLNQVLFAAAERLREAPDSVGDVLRNARADLRRTCSEQIDYLELRDEVALAPLERLDRPARLLAALHIGTTRLIDNIRVVPA